MDNAQKSPLCSDCCKRKAQCGTYSSIIFKIKSEISEFVLWNTKHLVKPSESDFVLQYCSEFFLCSVHCVPRIWGFQNALFLQLIGVKYLLCGKSAHSGKLCFWLFSICPQTYSANHEIELVFLSLKSAHLLACDSCRGQLLQKALRHWALSGVVGRRIGISEYSTKNLQTWPKFTWCLSSFASPLSHVRRKNYILSRQVVGKEGIS